MNGVENRHTKSNFGGIIDQKLRNLLEIMTIKFSIFHMIVDR